MSEEELKQMSGDELTGIIKAQKFEIKEKDLLIQELRDTIDNQREEIDRLNNIINELEKWINKNINDINTYFENTPFGVEDTYKEVLDKLKALKENK